jgi:hypothetical protein
MEILLSSEQKNKEKARAVEQEENSSGKSELKLFLHWV